MPRCGRVPQSSRTGRFKPAGRQSGCRRKGAARVHVRECCGRAPPQFGSHMSLCLCRQLPAGLWRLRCLLLWTGTSGGSANRSPSCPGQQQDQLCLPEDGSSTSLHSSKRGSSCHGPPGRKQRIENNSCCCTVGQCCTTTFTSAHCKHLLGQLLVHSISLAKGRQQRTVQRRQQQQWPKALLSASPGNRSISACMQPQPPTAVSCLSLLASRAAFCPCMCLNTALNSPLAHGVWCAMLLWCSGSGGVDAVTLCLLMRQALLLSG